MGDMYRPYDISHQIPGALPWLQKEQYMYIYIYVWNLSHVDVSWMCAYFNLFFNAMEYMHENALPEKAYTVFQKHERG